MLFGKKEIDLSKPVVMGIINITPDSFYDGGKYFSSKTKKPLLSKIKASIDQMISDGALIVDVGAQTTKPGFRAISEQEELDRIMPVLEILKESPLGVSLDSFSLSVIKESLNYKVDMVNNVFSFENKKTFDFICSKDLMISVCHQGGKDLKNNIFKDVNNFFENQFKRFKKSGFDTKKMIFDPGFGYGKSVNQNLSLLANIQAVKKDRLLLVGLSQKKFLKYLFEDKQNHLNKQSYAAAIIAAIGGANILRVHQVKETVNLLGKVFD